MHNITMRIYRPCAPVASEYYKQTCRMELDKQNN